MEMKPKVTEKFNSHQVGGVTVFVNKGITFNRERVSLDIRRYLFTHEIFIDGVDIAY